MHVNQRDSMGKEKTPDTRDKTAHRGYWVTTYTHLIWWTFSHQDTEASSSDSMGRQNLYYVLWIINWDNDKAADQGQDGSQPSGS